MLCFVSCQAPCKYDHCYIEGPCQCKWIWLDARKKSLCLHVNPRKPRESPFQTGFWPIRFLKCIVLYPLEDLYDVFFIWKFFYMCTDLIMCAGRGHLTGDVLWKNFEIWMGQLKVKVKHASVTTATLECQPCQLNSPLNSKLTWVYNNSIYLLFTTKTKPNSNKLLSK